MLNNLKLRHIGLTIILCSACIRQSGAAMAACPNPAGAAGDQMYNSTHNVMQFCDGTHWTAMKKGTETDPQVSSVTNGSVCKGNGSAMTCNLTMPSCSGTNKLLQWNGSAFTCANAS
jgi:hypothetical protein